MIGIGQAGGKISERLLAYDVNNNTEESYFVRESFAVNTAQQDLYGLDAIPKANRVMIGESDVKGNGVGADNEKGMKIMSNEANRVVDKLYNVNFREIDAFLLVAALGGGTGSGGMPVLAKKLRDKFGEPVFGLGVLPATSEGTVYTINAARVLKPATENTDNLILFDNDAWAREKSLQDSYTDLNSKLAERLGTLLSATQSTPNEEIGENVIDASEIINTLNCGGISTIGQYTTKLDTSTLRPNILRRLLFNEQINEEEVTRQMTDATRNAINGKLTVESDIEGVQRSLILFSGPKKYTMSQGVEQAISEVERRTGSVYVRGGDNPRRGLSMSVSVLLSGIQNSERLSRLQQRAQDAIESSDNTQVNESMFASFEPKFESIDADEEGGFEFVN